MVPGDYGDFDRVSTRCRASTKTFFVPFITVLFNFEQILNIFCSIWRKKLPRAYFQAIKKWKLHESSAAYASKMYFLNENALENSRFGMKVVLLQYHEVLWIHVTDMIFTDWYHKKQNSSCLDRDFYVARGQNISV